MDNLAVKFNQSLAVEFNQTLAVEFNQTIDTWYEKATVRYTPRIVVPQYSTADQIYPATGAIICGHTLVRERGLSTQSYILTQTAYQYLFGVGLIETKFVIRCVLDLAHNYIDGINIYDRLEALTVLIDEGYHAHVALDYITQVRNESGIEPLREPATNRMIDATLRAYEKLPEEFRMDFQLLATTLAENVLTEEIANMSKQKELEETFSRLMKEHVRDEGRHANYFVNLMKKRWSQLSPEAQQLFGKMLPEYLDDFLGVDASRGFERSILQACNFSAIDIEQIISDTNAQYIAGQTAFSEKTKARLYRLLKHLGVLDLEENQRAFYGRSYT